MSTIRANPGPLQFARGSFRPKGHLLQVGRETRDNPIDFESDDVYAARLIVGFNVEGEAVYTLDDLVELVTAIRTEQGKPDASFLAQKGVYQHRESGHVVVEDSAQVLIVDVWGTSQKDFVAEMIQLAEHIAREMRQELVILDIQRNGLTQKVYGVKP